MKTFILQKIVAGNNYFYNQPENRFTGLIDNATKFTIHELTEMELKKNWDTKTHIIK